MISVAADIVLFDTLMLLMTAIKEQDSSEGKRVVEKDTSDASTAYPFSSVEYIANYPPVPPFVALNGAVEKRFLIFSIVNCTSVPLEQPPMLLQL